jgi:TRAP transporter 4TM/12TM fusion protein
MVDSHHVVPVRAGRGAQGLLAGLLILGAIAWSLDLFRAVGLVLFAEQFIAAAYGVGLALTYLRFRARRSDGRTEAPWYDRVCAVVALVTCAYVTFEFPRLTALAGTVTPLLLTISTVLTLLTIEAVRRTIGWSLVIILLAIAGYCLIGHRVPGQLRTRKVELGELLVYLNLDNNGLLGLILQITVIVVIPFVLMGQLLMRSGGSGFFNDIAIALMGRYRGGAAKMAVVGSSLFGMISGIAAANAVAVGVVTIPLMKRSGMPPRLAGAVEACASNGGQLMPPVMGAVAFVMADFLQLPYKEVAIAAILPSVLYYAALFIQADLEAARYGFGKLDAAEIPRAASVLVRGWIFILPFIALIATMFMLNWEPEASAVLACAVIIAIGLIIGYGGTRMRWRDVWTAIVETSVGVCEILVVSAAAGFIMGLFQVSGLAFAFAAYFVNLGGQSLLLLLLLAAVVSIVLGMGLPTLGVYVLLAILVAPALVKVGIPPLAAHMFILYFGMMSLITPPVAPAAFVAAAIAQAPSMATGWTAMRFGWAAYIVPFLFVYSPAILMMGSTADVVIVTVTSLAGIWLICVAMTGYFARVLDAPLRIAFFAAGVLLMLPHQVSDLVFWLNVAGGVAGALLVAHEWRMRRDAATARASATPPSPHRRSESPRR